MKKIISLLLCVVMLMSLGIFAEAKEFSDLSADHWAYANIQTLVDEGTINGYDDGTFKPSKNVTRAEFVKMLGKWDRAYEGAYSDISENHWAYEYIMWSGLDSVGNMIYPDQPILRSDVINLLWKRNGSPKHDLAPGAISSQGTNPDATSWAYTIGIMKGDDGLNLRLDSSLTRAEAAAIIIRSRELVEKNDKNNFVDVISDEILIKTYEGLNLLGDSYNAARTFTYGEIARMAIVFAADGKAIQFVGNDLLNSDNELVKLFEHKYSNEMLILSSNVWGDDFYKPENADKTATVQDAVSAILYGYMRRGTAPADLGDMDSYYPDCVDAKSTTFENLALTYASNKGIKLYAGDTLGAQEAVTAEKYAAIMIQLNEFIGLGVAYYNGDKIAAKMNTNLSAVPENYKDFKLTIAGIPTALYGLKKDGVIASDAYNSINQCAFVYNGYLSEVANLAKKVSGTKMSYTFYPSVSYKQDGKVNFVARFNYNSSGTDAESVSFDELFESVVKEPTGKTVENGDEIYVLFETYEPLMAIHLTSGEAYVKGVFIS